MAVIPVVRDDEIMWLECRDGPDGHRLLAVIEVEEARDLAAGVQLPRFILELPDQEHLVEEVQEDLLVQVRCCDLCSGLPPHPSPAASRGHPGDTPAPKNPGRRLVGTSGSRATAERDANCGP